MRLRAVVTGGAGFIGSHLVEALLGDGWRVGVVDDLSTGRADNLPPEAELVRSDVRGAEAARFVIRFRPDAVAHLAAQPSVARSVEDPAADAGVNVLGTVAVAAACREAGVARLVFASSAAVYGVPRYLPADEEHPVRPVSPYGVAKLAAEHYVRVLGESAGLSWVVLRYANVYGPRQDRQGEAGVVAVFAGAAAEGTGPLPVHGDGHQTRDFVFVGDVAEATLRAMRPQAGGGHVLNVGTGQATSVLELAAAVWAAAGRQGPVPVAFGPPRPGDIRHSRLDPRRAEALLGWRPVTSLQEGLRRTLRALGARGGA